jgi:flagellar hook-basal body complex protein FliE
MAAITPIRSIPIPELTPSPALGGQGGQGGEFRDLIESAIGKVEQTRADASQTVESFLSGEGGELHTAVLATQKAELALDLFLETRNKVVAAYQEIMRMQI